MINLIEDQNHWKTIYPQCNGNAQSPINIDTNAVLSAKSQFPQINRSDVSYDWTSTNNGHTCMNSIILFL